MRSGNCPKLVPRRHTPHGTTKSAVGPARGIPVYPAQSLKNPHHAGKINGSQRARSSSTVFSATVSRVDKSGLWFSGQSQNNETTLHLMEEVVFSSSFPILLHVTHLWASG